jgi:nitrogen fixation protein FixH
MAKVRQSGWWYPWIFVGGMAVVIAVNVVMITLAVGTFPGLDTKDYYRKGVTYNRTLAADRAQAQRGWHMDFAFAPFGAAADDPHRGEVVVTFTDREGRPLESLEVEGTLIRPTREGIDVTLDFDNRGHGAYAATISPSLPGQWKARIHARQGSDNFQEIRRIDVP